MHGTEELTGVAMVAVVAALIGLGMLKLRQPPIVGYILAGVLLGPGALGLVDNREAIALLAELGVILLLFFIGMELSLRSFRLIWRGTVLIAMAQITLGLLVMFPIVIWFDWPLSWAVLGGFCLALSSTAVAVKILEDVGAMKSRAGRMALGVLIAQDLAVAPMLLIINGLRNFINQTPATISVLPENVQAEILASSGEGASMASGLLKIGFELSLTLALLVALIVYFSKRKRLNFIWLSHAQDRPDLLPLISLALCFGIATLSGLLGLSPAFGAFIAGLVVGNSVQRDSMRHAAEPVQAVLLMVFFLSVGLLLDLTYVWDNLWLLLLLWFLVTIFKTVINVILARVVGNSWSDSLTVALVIGQMGEFSFILAAAASTASVIEGDIYKLIVALTVLSLATSPLYVQLVRRNRHRAMRRISDLHNVLRFIFFREWRIGRHLIGDNIRKVRAKNHNKNQE